MTPKDIKIATNLGMLDRFENDNFTSRRTTGHNMFDPESLMSGEEEARGMTYTNSRRVWPSADVELDAIEGRIDTDEVLRVAPRQFK
jgi:hypothetical protein